MDCFPFFLGSLLVLGSVFWSGAITAQPPAVQEDVWSKPLLLGAHRGGRGLWPENTALAYREAAARWPEILLEGDVRETAEGVPVLLHDEDVDRTTDGSGKVAEMTLEQVKKLDAGYRFTPDNGATFPYRGKGVTIPTLREALDAAPDQRFLMELKGGMGLADAVGKVVLDAGATGRFLAASFKFTQMERLRAAAPGISTCFDFRSARELLKALRGGDWDGYHPRDRMLTISTDMRDQFKLTPEEIARIRAKGVLYQVFTINDPEEMRALIASGVDSMLTDRPDVLDTVMHEAR